MTERVVIVSKGRFDRALSRAERDKKSLPSRTPSRRTSSSRRRLDVWEIPPEQCPQGRASGAVPRRAPRTADPALHVSGRRRARPVPRLGVDGGGGRPHRPAVRRLRHRPAYVDLAKVRVEKEKARRARHDGDEDQPMAFVLPAVPSSANTDEDFQARAVREGRAAKEVAATLLEGCGFEDIKPDVRISQGGVEVNFQAYDQSGLRWYFDVSGGFTSNRPGLKRTDTLWKALGKAAVLREIEPKVKLVLLTTDPPAKGSSGDIALNVLCGPGKPIADVIRMQSAEDQQRLRGLASGVTANSE